MRERKTGRLLALLLVAALLLSLLPATVLAVEPGAATTSNDDSLMRIVHLDCGRKYFTVDWVMDLIDEMAENEYTHLELAFGNDGLRFLLDDMAIDVEGGDDTWFFGSDKVKNAIKDGNDAYDEKKGYHPGDTEEWTQDDMDEIISYASSKNISIIPLLNTPGHMDAILSAANSLGKGNFGYNGSKTTIDLQKSIVVAFTQALVEKYVTYFAGKGCTYFNMGADEYANDIYKTGSMGFGQLVSTGNYSLFVNYVNDISGIIKQAGMTPMAFNDGFYFNGNTGSFDTDINICFWTAGWNGYQSATAAQMEDKGHKMINTHGDYYYVLGKDDKYTQGETATHAGLDASFALNFENNKFMGSEVASPAGSMFCIWCDNPDAETQGEISEYVINSGLLSNMASAMKRETTTPPTDPKPDYTREETISLAVGDTFSVTVKGNDLSGETYNPKPTGYANVNVNYTPGEIITADGYWERVTEGVAGIVSGQEYLIIANEESEGKDGGHILTTTGGTETINAAKDAKISNNTVDINHQFIITESGDGYTLKGKNNNYLYPDASHHFWGWDYSLKSNQSTPKVVSINANEKGTFHIVRDVQDDGETTTTALNYKEPWIGSPEINASENGHPFFLYRYVPGEITEEPGTNTITFTGLKEGKASVVIGDTMYTINVTPQSLVGVDNLTIEYWITNGRTVDDQGNDHVDISASRVYSEAGVDVTELVPEKTFKDPRDVQYWRCRLLDTSKKNNSNSGTEEQTNESGDDETYNGREFTKVRYWNNTWSVYCVNTNEWVVVESKHQLVAYYLEILPVADELLVNAADWGKKGDGSTSGDYMNPQTPCTVSVQVIYEDGTTNPKSTSAADLNSRTIGYDYWPSGRGIGTLNLNGLEGYQIWKIEAETGSHKGTGEAWGSYTVKSFNWDNNPVTVYEGDPVDSYVIHNDANNPTRTGIYENLMWDENKESILIKVYVKAPVTKDSLTVHYLVNGTNVEFHHYVINVVDGTLFNENIALNSQNHNGDLLNGTVKNVFGVEQTVTADLTKMSEIGAQYRYSDFNCVRVERSPNGKDVFLYYTFKNTHDFVIDFGLPLTISAQDLGLTEVVWDGATVNPRCSFGSASIDTTAKTITYTPNKVLTTADTITLTFTDENGGAVSHQIFIYPASNVLYEETFFDVTTDYSVPAYNQKEWTVTSAVSIPTQSAAQNTLYGYDAAYSSSTGDSLGSHLTVNVPTSAVGSEILATTFYGNGFDLIGTAGPDTGYVYLLLGKHGADGTIASVDAIVIDTSYVQKDDNNEYITLHQVPLAHKEYEEDATYTAYVYASYRAAREETSTQQARASTFSLMSASSPLDEIYAVLAEFEAAGLVINDIEFVSVDENSVLSESADAQVSLFSVPATGSDTDTTAAKSAPARPAGTTVTIDGFRVYRKAIDSNFAAAYARAGEDKFKYINILDAVLNPDGNNENFESFAYVEGGATGYTQADYEKSGGPQNELYLKAGRGVVIKVGGQGAAQFSARAVTGSCDFSVLVDGFDAKPYTANHNTELYYAAPDTGVITVVNNSKTDMLALGNLKILGDATVSTLSAEDVRAACLMLASAFPVDPGDIEEPEVPVEPETPAVFEPAKLDVKVNSTKVLFNKLVTVTVSASADVDNLTINGKTLYPTNSLLVKWGLSKTYTYIYVDTVKRTESKSYEIVAYNDAGVASDPVTVRG